LFAIMWLFSRRSRPPFAISGMFLITYGGLRFITEFFREPDRHLMFIAFDWMTMGQLLSLPMIALGVSFLFYSYHKETV